MPSLSKPKLTTDISFGSISVFIAMVVGGVGLYGVFADQAIEDERRFTVIEERLAQNTVAIAKGELPEAARKFGVMVVTLKNIESQMIMFATKSEIKSVLVHMEELKIQIRRLEGAIFKISGSHTKGIK